MRANVRASADHLRHGSRLIEDLVVSGRVAVVGAEYELETGAVERFTSWTACRPSPAVDDLPAVQDQVAYSKGALLEGTVT